MLLGLLAGILAATAVFGLVSRWKDREAALRATAGSAAPSVPTPGPSAQKTRSGVVYEDLVTGSGTSPTRQKVLTLELEARLSDGTLIDSTARRGKPFSYKYGTGQAIDSFDEAVATMRIGGRRILWVPAQVGYPRGAPDIPAGATLIFDVRLLRIEDDAVEDG